MTQPLAVLLAAVVLVIFTLGAIIGTLALGDGAANKAAVITAILTATGPLLGVIIIIIRQQFTISKVDHVVSLVNGHLLLHTDPTTPTGTPPPGPAS